MTNYTTYPKHRLIKNSCIICFSQGSYSWCMLTNKQRLYLLSSGYADSAYKVVVRFLDGEIQNYSIDEFKSWLSANFEPKEGTASI